MTVSAPPADLEDFRQRRRTMVDCQVRTFDVTDQRLLARMLEVPRERYVPEATRSLAYSDVGLVLEPEADGAEARYLLPPLILARLIQGGRVEATDKVLDVGCGAGYSTAVLAGLAGAVVALETGARRQADLRARLADLGNVRIQGGDGSGGPLGDLAAGAPSEAPFDVILVNGAVEANLEALLEQLAPGGRLLAIRRDGGDPTGRAAKAMCLENHAGRIGSRYLFDASAPVPRAFRKTPQFVF